MNFARVVIVKVLHMAASVSLIVSRIANDSAAFY